MRLLQSHPRTRQRVSPVHPSARQRRAEPWTPICEDDIQVRHDAQMPSDRRVPVDPYAVWVAKREADRALDRLDSRGVWDALRS